MDDFSGDNGSESRQYQRVPLTMEVHYRTVEYRTMGSFLVSYSINLSKGGLFLETNDFLPIGSALTVRLVVPGADQPVETSARVKWIRKKATPDGMPAGVGLQFDHVEEQIGSLIDQVIRDFGGVRLLAVAGDSRAQERLARYLRNIIHCEVSMGATKDLAQHVRDSKADLVVFDSDSAPDGGLRALKEHTKGSDAIPVVVLTRSETVAQSAAKLGATAMIGNPPRFEALRECILEVLGRPAYPR